MIPLARFRVNSPTVIHETIDNEVIIINLDTGSYYSLEKTGADIWNLIVDKVAAGEIVATLGQRYSGNRTEIEGAIRQFLSVLEEEGLIVKDRATDLPESKSLPLPPVTASDGVLALFEPPVLRKYTDMQEFILLDPIHEAEEPG